MIYNPARWYWFVGDKSPATQLYSSAAVGYVPLDDVSYVAWRDAGGVATRIDTEANLRDVFAQQYAAGWPKMQYSPLDFMARFSTVENVAMATLAQSNAAALLVLIQFAGAQYIDLSDPRTAAGLDVFKSSGVLSAARVTAVLTP